MSSIASGVMNVISLVIFLFTIDVSFTNIRGSWREKDYKNVAFWVICLVMVTAVLVMVNDAVHKAFG